ncbi:hypothetical protein AWB83_01798 [Caballeronia ptereochthonis]|uniref:Uncharacterized protein n=1 Tax=Caballeronia ptereochthonis TaxID=1777144 RepID=A0A158AG28_9BURK|nr:hypothetical protein AWB83_01798 [Caballeronia ptereochthonis]
MHFAGECKPKPEDVAEKDDGAARDQPWHPVRDAWKRDPSPLLLSLRGFLPADDARVGFFDDADHALHALQSCATMPCFAPCSRNADSKNASGIGGGRS